MRETLLDTPGWALVQGASRGIGAALVEVLLAQDQVLGVVATSRSPEQAPALAALAERHGERLQRVPIDLEQPASIEAAAEKVQTLCASQLRVLINAAGLLHDDAQQPEKRLENVEAAALARAFAVNATGPILMARHFLRLFPRKGRSLIASLSARVGSIGDNRLGGWYAYRASKAAQNQLTRTLAIELSRRLPECICVGLHPGTVATDLSAPFSNGVPEHKLFTAERAASMLVTVLSGLQGEDSGACYAWDGERITP